MAAGVLAENNRLGEFAKISDSFDELMDAARGHVNAIITTASVSEGRTCTHCSASIHTQLWRPIRRGMRLWSVCLCGI